MYRFSPVLRTLTAALAFIVVTPVLSKTVPSVVLQCDVQTHPQICSALAEALRQRLPDQSLVIVDPADALEPPAPALTIRYREQNRTQDWLVGQLIWQVQQEPPVTGPALELSVMDKNLQGIDLASFAEALIQISGLRISNPTD